jgi:hypothetical protein
LSPQIVNIDRIHAELHKSGKINQCARDWANAVSMEAGKPLQCDAENGGKDRKAYLLVPAPLIPIVQPMLRKYLASIRTEPTSNNQAGSSDRPDEIYVPTAIVQRNINFLRNMSSADIWKNAPSTIRHSQSYQTPIPTPTKETIRQDATVPPEHEQARTPIRHGNSPNLQMTTQYYQIITNVNLQEQTNPPSGISTTIRLQHQTLPASTTLNSSYQANRFAELEADIKTTQQNLKSMHTQYQTMENKILNTMTLCHENSKQMITMQQGQMTNMQTTIQSIADQMQFITRLLTDSTSAIAPLESNLNSPSKETKATWTTGGSGRLTYDTTAIPTTPVTYNQQTNADQEEAQYTENSSPDTAMAE